MVLGVMAHLERYFHKYPGMCWANMHLWHSDRKVPIAKFKNLADVKEQLKCFKIRNLQPMRARDNLVQGAR